VAKSPGGCQNFFDFHRHDGQEQIALGLVVIVERADRHLGMRGNVLDSGLVIALFADELRGRIQQSGVSLGFATRPQTQGRALSQDFRDRVDICH
jgi:hypothetical protein